MFLLLLTFFILLVMIFLIFLFNCNLFVHAFFFYFFLLLWFLGFIFILLLFLFILIFENSVQIEWFLHLEDFFIHFIDVLLGLSDSNLFFLLLDHPILCLLTNIKKFLFLLIPNNLLYLMSINVFLCLLSGDSGIQNEGNSFRIRDWFMLLFFY